MKIPTLFQPNKKIIVPESTISSLAPKVLTKQEEVKKIRPYLDKLKETIAANEVNNIAVTGSYGSGKSTIIKTFKELYPEYEYLNISLAAFNQKEGKPTQTEKEELERMLEVSILQQIFYHVKPNQIPESRFKRIVNRPWWKFLLISIGFVSWVISTILLLKYDYLDKINPVAWKTDTPFDWFSLLFVAIAFGGLGVFSKLMIQLFSNSKINKVNIKGELELGDNINKSVFNEHLEEILYFFERTKYNVVIIEDLDRFDNTDIFTKLREINILLNNSRLIKRHIKFIYAVGDDLFQDKKERVKFFEYIIPVIPFINASNAREALQTLIKESGLDQDIFSNEFMSDVVTFIDDIDMRLLTNIFHEFVIYRNMHNPEFVKKNEELFSIITYKNIEPGDFARLNNKEGKLYDLITNKKIYIAEIIKDITRNIQVRTGQVKEIEEQSIADVKELRAIYINRVLSKIPLQAFLNESIHDLLDDTSFQKIIDGQITYQKLRYNSSYGKYDIQNAIPLNYSFQEIEKEINPKYSYKQRLKLLDDRKDSKVEILKKEIAKLNLKKAVTESWELKQIFEEVDLNQYLSDFTNSGLLRNLIINGYINENYNDYISLFHEGAITKEDLAFERNVKAGYPPNFSYQLNKIEGLIERIDLRYFGKECILNFDLVDYLGNNHETYTPYYKTIIHLLSNERERSIAFIDEYIQDEVRPIRIFIETLTTQWNNFFHYVVKESVYDKDKINNYLRLILTYAGQESILRNQAKGTLVETISTNPEFLSLVKNTKKVDFFDKISGIIKELDIKFESLARPSAETRKLFDYIFQNNHYEINKENIWQMMEANGEGIDINTFNSKNYSSIKKSGLTQLIQYIDDNINDYIENVYLNIETNTQEGEDYLIGLLNNDDILDANKKTIIERAGTTISDTSQIDDEELAVFIFGNNKVEATWKNIYKTHQYYGEVSEDIIGFVNNSENAKYLSELSVPKNKDEHGKMIYIKMWKDLLTSPNLSMESFKYLLRSSNIEIKYFDFEHTAKDRLELMIANRKFAFVNKVFDNLEDFHSLGRFYLENYKKEVLDFNDSLTFGEIHLEQILSSKDYSVDEINRIIDTYDITDWQSDSFLSNLQDRLADDKGLNIDTTKIIKVVSSYQSDSHNLQILNNYFDKFSIVEIKTIIKFLKNPEYQKYLSNDITESLRLEHQPHNDLLFELMKANGYIAKSSKHTKKGYQIFKNKGTKLF